MITNTYKVYVNGRELPETYTSEWEACDAAHTLSETFERTSVGCITEYSDDDKTPLAARTGFHCCRRFHNYGLRNDFGGDYDNV